MTSFYGSILKIPLILAILIFMSNLNIMLSCVEHEKSFITLGPGRNPEDLFSHNEAHIYLDFQQVWRIFYENLSKHYL